MADLRLLPPGINDERGRILLDLIERVGTLDLTKLLVYRLAGADDDILHLLAWQFHIMGDEGFVLATTSDQKRQLVKKAIEIHRYRGTPWAVKEALNSIGYPDSRVIERRDLIEAWRLSGGFFIDGSEALDGSETLSGDPDVIADILARHWAEYDVELNQDPDESLVPEQQLTIRRFVKLNAPARSHFIHLTYRITLHIAGILMHRTFITLNGLGLNLDGSESLDGTHTLRTCKEIDGTWSLNGIAPVDVEIGFGTGTTPAAAGDSALEAEYLRKAVDLLDVECAAAEIQGVLLGSEAVGIETTEVGVFADGELVSRASFAPKELDAESQMVFDLEFAY